MQTSTSVQFGPFQVNLATGELCKYGIPMKVQEQPIKILIALLKRPRELVTREELVELLWPDQVYVDFEGGLNAAVNRLRRSLSDSAENPRYIQTVPRRGYCFIGEMHSVPAVAPVTIQPESAHQPVPSKQRSHWKKVWVATVIASTITGSLIWVNFPKSTRRHPMRRLTHDTNTTFQPGLSTDGKLLAYTSLRAGKGKSDIWLQEIEGGAERRLTYLPENEQYATFSPDSSKVAFWYTGTGPGSAAEGIYIVSVVGGEPYKIVNGYGASPRFSPDGKWLAYAGRIGVDFAVFVVPVTGGNPLRLAPEFHLARNPVWSRDAKHILFLGRPKRTGPEMDGLDFWVTPAAGGTPVKTGTVDLLLKQGIIAEGEPTGPVAPAAWYGDRVIFDAGRGSESVHIWAIQLNPRTLQVSGGAQQITFGGATESSPSVSAGGELAFASLTIYRDSWGVLLDANKGTTLSDLQQLTHGSASELPGFLTLDGSSLLFSSIRSGNLDVWKKQLTTGTEEKILATPKQEHVEGISQDASAVLYSVSEHGHSVTYLHELTGSARKICVDCRGVLSPDGLQILYAQTTLKQPDELFVFDVNSGSSRPIGKAWKDICMPCLGDARFSPDGSWIATVRTDNRSGAYGSGIMSVPFRDGLLLESDAVVVTSRAADGIPAWSPDGNLLYFRSGRDGQACIWAQRLHPSTKTPMGKPFVVQHLHETEFSPTMSLSVSSNRLVVERSRRNANIWLTRLD